MFKFLPLLAVLISGNLVGQTTLLTEDFSSCSLPAGWDINTSAGSVGWDIGDETTLSGNGFVIPPGNGCFAAMNDASSGNSATEDVLVMPGVDVTSVQSVRLSFNAFLTNSSYLYVQFSVDSIAWTGFWSSVGVTPGLSWQKITANIEQVYLNGASDLWVRFVYQDFGFETLGAAVDDILLEEPANLDLWHYASEKYDYVLSGSNDLRGAVINYGLNTIYSYNLNWSIDNGPAQTQLVVDVLGPNARKPYHIANAFNATVGDHTLKIWTSSSTSTADPNPSNDTITYTMRVRNNLPEKHVLLEKFTHHLCGPCYQGDIDFQKLLDDHPFTSGVSIHAAASDPMTIPDGQAVDDLYIPAHPYMVADRHWFGKNFYFEIKQYLGETEDLNIRHNQLEGASVEIENYNYDTQNGTLDFDLRLNVAADYDKQLALNVYILEDSIQYYQASAPNPNDYYHNHVLRAMLSGSWGDATGIPATVQGGDTYVKHYTYTLQGNWDPEEISIIGLVQLQNNTEIFKREIVNSTEAFKIAGISNGIKEYAAEKLLVYPNPATDRLYIGATNFDRLEIYDPSGRLVLTAGNNRVVDISVLETGGYILIVKSSDQTLTTRFIKH